MKSLLLCLVVYMNQWDLSANLLGSVQVNYVVTDYTTFHGYPTPQKISLCIQREVVHAMLGCAELLLAIFEKYSDSKTLNNNGSSIESVGAQI